MPLFLSIGEAMVELSQHESGLWEQRFAGDTLNTAWYARQCLGTDWRISYLTRLGNDRFSSGFLDFLATSQIETPFISRDPHRNIGLYAIELTEGERSFYYWRGHSAARNLADDETLLSVALEAAELIYFSGITLAILTPDRRALVLALIKKARAEGKQTAFDPNIRPSLWEDTDTMRATLTSAAACATIALPSFDDEARVFGDLSPMACAERWLRSGAEEVVVKNGGGPVVLLDKSSRHDMHLMPVKPIDSTGAGDAFNGGYLAARLQGQTMTDAAHAAHALSVHVIGHRGALVSRSTHQFEIE